MKSIGFRLSLLLWIALASFVFLPGCSENSPTATTGIKTSQTATPPRPTASRTRAIRPNNTPSPSPSLTPIPVTPLSILGVNAESLRDMKVQFWHLWPDENGDALRALVADFDKTNPWGVQVEASGQNGWVGMEEQIELALQTRSLPDLAVAYTDRAARWDWVGDTVVDLNAYVYDPLWGLTHEELQDFAPAIWEQDMLPVRSSAETYPGQEKRMGLPWYRSGLVMFYNLTWAAELGFQQPPETAAEFQRQVCLSAQADRGADGVGGWMITPEVSLLSGWIFAFGGELERQNGPGYQFNSPEAAQALLYLKRLHSRGCAWINENRYPYQDFSDRKALAFFGGLSSISALQKIIDQANGSAAGARDNWGMFPFPAGEKQPIVPVYGPSLVIFSSSPERQLAAWLFARWLVSPENQARWISANHYFPSRVSARNFLGPIANQDLLWRSSLDFLPYLKAEPADASWNEMRWAMWDAMLRLMSPEFKAEQIPQLLGDLDELAAELQVHIR